MIKIAQAPKKRFFAIMLIGFFALLFQLSLPQKAQAYDEDMANAFDQCMQNPVTADPDTDGKQRDEEMKVIIDCVQPIGMTFTEVQMICSDEKYQNALDMEKCEAIMGRRTQSDPDNIGEYQTGAVSMEDNKCVSNVRAVAWFGCPIIDDLSNSISRHYANIVEDWLFFEPAILKRDLSNPTDNTVYRVWSVMRGYANIVFLLLLIIMIISEIINSGNYAYSIRKLLPKLLVTVLLVNLSYYICQIVVDLSNIIGHGIGNLVTHYSELIDLSQTGLISGAWYGTKVIIVIVLMILAAIVAFLATGPAMFTPIIIAILSFFLSVLFVYVMLVIRQALMILMVCVSPIAIALSALPNTESIYKKWFNMFRGLIMTYPIASGLFYGGNFAARLMMKVCGVDSVISLICSIILCIFPVTMLPQITRSSVAAIDRLMLKAQGGINRFAANRVRNNRWADRAEEIRRQKANRRASFTYLDKKTGELKSGIPLGFGKAIGISSRHRTQSMDYNLKAAEMDLNDERRIGFYNDNNAQIFNQFTSEAEVAEAELKLAGRGPMPVDALVAELDKAFGDSSRADDPHGDNGMVVALTRRLFESGEAGRLALNDYMRSRDVESNAAAARSMGAVAATVLSMGESAKGYNPEMYDYCSQIANDPNGAAGVGNYSSYVPPASIYEGTSGEKLAKMDTVALERLSNRLSTMPAAQASNIIASAGRLIRSTDSRGLTSQKRQIIDRIRTTKI